MKFIFPQNYNFSTKLFGVINYSTLFFNIFYWVIIFIISNLIFNKLSLKIIFIIITCFPILLISLFGFQQENIIYVLKYIIKFLFNPKLYLYKK